MTISRTPVRSPLLRLLQHALAPQRELDLDGGMNRREFLQAGALGALGVGGLLSGCQQAVGPSGVGLVGDYGYGALATGTAPRIAIVGGGIAGLACAYQLKKQGLASVIYEGSGRVGGRVKTVVGALGAGMSTEFGAEFIDSSHKALLALAKEFGLPITDTDQNPGKLKLNCLYFDGQWQTTQHLLDQLAPIAKRILADQATLPGTIDYQHPGNAARFDRLSVSEYLDSLGVSGWLRRFMDVSYVSEYGADPGEQSALNAITLISNDDLQDDLYVFGDSDERYHIQGGNQRVTDELARRLDGQIRMGQRLEAIKGAGSGYRLTFATGQGSVDVDADVVVLTLPFNMLREVAIGVDLPAAKRNAIATLGYGTGAKVMLGFNHAAWRDAGYLGTTFSDVGIQVGWDNGRFQNVTTAGYTVFAGGTDGARMGDGTPEDQGRTYLAAIEKAFPGSAAAFNGRVARAHWPSEPLIKGSYSFFRPTQWTTVAGATGMRVGNLLFAGEHCSTEFQGYINGGAQTGLDAAKAIAAAAKR